MSKKIHVQTTINGEAEEFLSSQAMFDYEMYKVLAPYL